MAVESLLSSITLMGPPRRAQLDDPSRPVAVVERVTDELGLPDRAVDHQRTMPTIESPSRPTTTNGMRPSPKLRHHASAQPGCWKTDGRQPRAIRLRQPSRTSANSDKSASTSHRSPATVFNGARRRHRPATAGTVDLKVFPAR